MTPQQLIALVHTLDRDAPDIWITFARLIAEHCAEIADESCSSLRPGRAIREYFRLPIGARRVA